MSLAWGVRKKSNLTKDGLFVAFMIHDYILADYVVVFSNQWVEAAI